MVARCDSNGQYQLGESRCQPIAPSTQFLWFLRKGVVLWNWADIPSVNRSYVKKEKSFSCTRRSAFFALLPTSDYFYAITSSTLAFLFSRQGQLRHLLFRRHRPTAFFKISCSVSPSPGLSRCTSLGSSKQVRAMVVFFSLIQSKLLHTICFFGVMSWHQLHRIGAFQEFVWIVCNDFLIYHFAVSYSMLDPRYTKYSKIERCAFAVS